MEREGSAGKICSSISCFRVGPDPTWDSSSPALTDRLNIMDEVFLG